MEYLLGIPFVNRPDLLARAVASVRPLWPRTLVLDNSEAGLAAAEWPVPLVRPPVPLTFSQTMNWLQRLGEERGCDAVLAMHNDAEAAPGTAEGLLATVADALAAGRRWGVVFTHYDTLVAFNAAMVRDVGRWDTVLPQYFADCDYYRRVRLAGWDVILTSLPVAHHASSTVKSDARLALLHEVTFPLYRQYYLAKWGGEPGQERYAQPFKGAG